MAIKFINPKSVIEIVSLNDEAINKEESDMVAYAEGYDTTHLKYVEGSKPTIFVISNVGSSELVQIQQDHYVTEMPKILPGMTPDQMKNQKVKVTPVRTGEMLLKYFKAGCKKIIDDGKTIEVNDEMMDTIPSIILQEVGSFIMGRSLLSDTKKK